MPRKIFFTLTLLIPALIIYSQRVTTFSLASPNGKINISIDATTNLQWQVKHNTTTVLAPSLISLQLQSGEVLGEKVKVNLFKTKSYNKTITPVAYKKKTIIDNYNELTITCKGDYGVIFRAYDDGVAYRFFTKRNGELIIQNEKAEFNFDTDRKLWIPPTSDLRGGERYTCSFEEFYTETPVSKFNKDTLGYLPLLVELDSNKKAALLEADVQDYPATFVQLNQQSQYGIKAVFAPYPLQEALGGYNKINYMVTKRADYIAKVNGTRSFPWRAIVISEQDKELLNTDMVQKLSGPTLLEDASWLKPGKVAWDWWNDWNISHVDFKAGINNSTYKYYTDFASANKIEYIVLDEGWSSDWDLTEVRPQIDLEQLIAYGKQKNVGLILWSTWYALSKDIEGICKKYSEMGIKGFKVDFLDRNDQKMIASCYEMAAIAAKYHLMLDFHGMFPPQGLQHTWPNVINFEGVRGMEYSKWSADDRVPKHEVTLPFIRMMAGPLDYTPGAMRNVTKGNARPSNSLPVSQGTRCHQLAIYVVFEAPLQMLADNPTIYMKEQECTDFISSIPTTFDETVAIDGKVGEYAIIARKKNDVWYIGGMNNWDAREVSIEFPFLDKGADYTAELMVDGINANKNATDYKKETTIVSTDNKLTIKLESGGGFAAILRKK